jgi:anti-anti-sigma factor
MEIRKEHMDAVLVLHLSGELDSTSGPELQDILERAIAMGNRFLVLDLSGVPYISSIGLRALTLGLKALRAPEVQGDMYLAALSKTVAHAFHISGFNQLFTIFDTVAEAVEVITASVAFDAPDLNRSDSWT